MQNQYQTHTLHLKPNRHKRIKNGSLWAFAGEIAEDLKGLNPGEKVALCGSKGKLLGRGYVNPHSLIAVRLMARGEEEFDDKLIGRRILDAQAYRKAVYPDGEACRLVFSESDGLPGLVIDKYGDHYVVQSLTAGIEQRLEQIVAALKNELSSESIFLKGKSHFRELEKLPLEDRVLHGEPPESVVFSEEAVNFTAHPVTGQKTGFFLDQRYNRSLLKEFAAGKRVLDLYCYTGAWGITALKYGASEAIMLDSSEKAIEWGMEDAVRNDLSGRSFFVRADAPEFLADAAGSNEPFDVVILDPPALIPSRSAIKTGTLKYRHINELALKVVKPGGLLVSCSCSHLMDAAKHLELIGGAAVKLGRRVRVIYKGAQAPDHPILPGHPESDYLKCWFLHCE